MVRILLPHYFMMMNNGIFNDRSVRNYVCVCMCTGLITAIAMPQSHAVMKLLRFTWVILMCLYLLCDHHQLIGLHRKILYTEGMYISKLTIGVGIHFCTALYYLFYYSKYMVISKNTNVCIRNQLNSYKPTRLKWGVNGDRCYIFVRLQTE